MLSTVKSVCRTPEWKRDPQKEKTSAISQISGGSRWAGAGWNFRRLNHVRCSLDVAQAREEDVGRILKQKSHSSNEHHSQEAVGVHKEEGMWHTQPHWRHFLHQADEWTSESTLMISSGRWCQHKGGPTCDINTQPHTESHIHAPCVPQFPSELCKAPIHLFR